MKNDKPFWLTIEKGFGDDAAEETPVLIPNTAVKLSMADGTAWETMWKSR